MVVKKPIRFCHPFVFADSLLMAQRERKLSEPTITI